MPTWIDKILNSQSVQLGLAALAFLIALWLVVVIARMLMGGRLRLPGGRTRQARLGIVDAFDLDRQRQLIIVRRDNTEHLIMIGGPNDLVIESEIVRVEARDFRDSRRDKSFDNAADLRIPAPFSVPNTEAPATGVAPRSDEPMLPMPLPQAATSEDPSAPSDVPAALPAEPMAPRGPTFPLPPRRPVAPSPERRPPPPLPERASRADDLPPPSATPDSQPPAASIPTPPPPVTPVAPTPIAPVASPAVPAVEIAAPRPAPTRPAPFLKPLPPRPPIRPLKRVTPQAEPALPSEAPPANAAVPTPPAAAPTTPPPKVAPQAAVPAAPPPANAATGNDALESLEEEMAKLLGRG